MKEGSAGRERKRRRRKIRRREAQERRERDREGKYKAVKCKKEEERKRERPSPAHPSQDPPMPMVKVIVVLKPLGKLGEGLSLPAAHLLPHLMHQLLGRLESTLGHGAEDQVIIVALPVDHSVSELLVLWGEGEVGG